MGGLIFRDFARCLILALLGIGAALAGSVPAEALYDVQPDEIPGKPGTIIRVWPLEGGAPGGGNAFRILYRSTGLKGEIIPVSGAVYLPAGDPPPGGWRILAWAHPTTGVMPDCAPTLMPDNAGMIWGLSNMLAQGFVVAATDYPGLGTAGIHPYLFGDSEARSVIDSVRAARSLEGVETGNRFVVWGHSQGGQAALFTGQIARSYAPDLELIGVAAAAPATNLIKLFDDDIHDQTGKELASMALLSWSRVEDIPIEKVVHPEVMGAFRRTAEQCVESIAEFEKISRDAAPLSKEFLEIDPVHTPPWDKIMADNSPTLAIAAPVFIAQGTADTTVDPNVTKAYAEGLCAKGTAVHFVEMPGVSHTFAAKDSVGAALQWMVERFDGGPAPNSCEG